MEADQYDRFAEVDDCHWWFVARRKVVASLLNATFSQNSGMDILDIGTGSGGMIPLLSKLGSLVVTEPDEHAMRMTKDKYAKEHESIEYVNAGWESLDFGLRKFDLVTAFDVLEHCQNDISALTRWSGFLKENGCLLLTVPAFSCLWGANDRACHHYRRYTRSSLLDGLKQTSLTVERISYINALMFLPVWMSRNIKEKIDSMVTGKKDCSDCWDFQLPPKALNTVLEKTFSWESMWLPIGDLPVGTSVICLARKVADSI